jgi:hypothetical protein
MSSVNEWARQQWGAVELGDRRLNDRALTIGTGLAAHPDHSLPAQMNDWSDLKAAYRFLHHADVTHARLSKPHWQHTKEAAHACMGPVLFIQDGITLDFTGRAIKQMGRIGDDNGRGMLAHSVIAVCPSAPAQPPGLAHQAVWVREHAPFRQTETRTQRTYRQDKESAHWAQSLEAIGTVPDGACWISVGDRGSDVFDYWQRALQLHWHCLLRLQSNRCLLAANGPQSHLLDRVQAMQPMTSQTIVLRSRPGAPARRAKLHIAWLQVTITPPKNDPTARTATPIAMWVIRAWEDSAPQGVTPLSWTLLTTLPVASAEVAIEKLNWYRLRWLVEQYHKALKTGCKIERTQLQDGQAVRALLGFLSIVAIRLLQVETLARHCPALPAKEAVDGGMLEFLSHLLHRDTTSITIYVFWREIAKMGGFLARAGDGEPGWQTLWRGWNKFYPRFEGYLIGKGSG